MSKPVNRTEAREFNFYHPLSTPLPAETPPPLTERVYYIPPTLRPLSAFLHVRRGGTGGTGGAGGAGGG